MNAKYTASIYCSEEEISTKAGDDIDELYTWMLLQGCENIGDIRGKIIDNTTQEIIRTFCKAAVE